MKIKPYISYLDSGRNSEEVAGSHQNYVSEKYVLIIFSSFLDEVLRSLAGPPDIS